MSLGLSDWAELARSARICFAGRCDLDNNKTNCHCARNLSHSLLSFGPFGFSCEGIFVNLAPKFFRSSVVRVAELPVAIRVCVCVCGNVLFFSC